MTLPQFAVNRNNETFRVGKIGQNGNFNINSNNPFNSGHTLPTSLDYRYTINFRGLARSIFKIGDNTTTEFDFFRYNVDLEIVKNSSENWNHFSKIALIWDTNYGENLNTSITINNQKKAIKNGEFFDFQVATNPDSITLPLEIDIPLEKTLSADYIFSFRNIALGSFIGEVDSNYDIRDFSVKRNKKLTKSQDGRAFVARFDPVRSVKLSLIPGNDETVASHYNIFHDLAVIYDSFYLKFTPTGNKILNVPPYRGKDVYLFTVVNEWVLNLLKASEEGYNGVKIDLIEAFE